MLKLVECPISTEGFWDYVFLTGLIISGLKHVSYSSWEITIPSDRSKLINT